MASSSHLATLLILSAAALASLAPTCSAGNYLLSGSVLYSGGSLEYGDYKFTMQSDCNLVLYDDDTPVWASNTNNKGHYCTLHMQDDGNLVIYDGILGGDAIWASNSSWGKPGKYVLVLQPDRNVVIYGGAIWEAGSNVDDDEVAAAAAVPVSRKLAKPAVVAGEGISMVTGK